MTSLISAGVNLTGDIGPILAESFANLIPKVNVQQMAVFRGTEGVRHRYKYCTCRTLTSLQSLSTIKLIFSISQSKTVCHSVRVLCTSFKLAYKIAHQ
ncbi:unnamed protein product [Adineta ricciae]|uniref:Uncharacterized protein n=1 Tax=Adineta ricciae TaxID=249248 RepID=A0A814WNX3_ADIRI|nr:unnamed protein product [Adineta ricciae]